MTAEQQPRMFHVKHIDFERLKTWLLRNMSCLQCFHRTKRRRSCAPSAISLSPDRHNTDHYNRPHKLSPRRLEWSFVFIERKLDGRTTRQYTPSTSLNIFIDKASPETTSQRTRVERLVPLQTHTAAIHISADNKYSPAIKTAKSTKTRRMLCLTAPQNHQNLDNP